MPLLEARRVVSRWDGLEQLFSHKLWRETRVRPEPELSLIRTTVGYEKKEAGCWTCTVWHWPARWLAEIPRFKVCWWYIIFLQVLRMKHFSSWKIWCTNFLNWVLCGNGEKTVVLTNEAQPPSHFMVDTNGLDASSVSGLEGRRWTSPTTCKLLPKPFFANTNILCDQKVPVKERLRYFDAIASPVVLFGCGHRTVHQKDLHQLDVTCRKFLCAVVGPRSNIDWSRPWQEILRDWNGKAQSIIGTW